MIKSLLRRKWTWITASVVAVPAIAFATAPEWSQDVYIEIRDYSDNCKRIVEQNDERSDMQDDLEIVQNRIHLKEDILNRLILGAITLREAGEEFLLLDRENDFVLSSMYRPGSFVECSQSRVIQFLRIRYGDQDRKMTKPQAEIVSRMEQDFESQFGYKPPIQ
jgi:hypothetical protein